MSFSYYNVSDTGNTLELSATPLYPFHTHLCWEHSTYGFVFVRHDDQTKLVITTDKGATDVINIDLTGVTTKRIQSGWLDTNDLWLVCCNNPDDEFTVIYIELDNNNNVVDVGDEAGADANTVYVYDIFKIGANMYVVNKEFRSSTPKLVVWDVDTFAFTEKDTWTGGDCSYTLGGGSFVTIVGTDAYFNLDFEDCNFGAQMRYNSVGGTIIEGNQLSSGYSFASRDQQSMTYDGSNYIYYIMTKDGDGFEYLIVYSISGNSYEILSRLDVVLMLDRNVHGSTPPFTLEKGFHISEDKIYQIPAIYNGRLNFISKFNFTGTIKAITDHYIVDSGGKFYEFKNLLSHVFDVLLFTSRNYFPYLEMKYNSDNITIAEQQFVQIIGPYTADGSTTANQVVFEGIAKKPIKGRIQFVLVENQGSEMEHISPRGNKSGRSDEIIVDINNDGAPDGPTYITNGTLANGGAMGTLDLSGAKILRTVYNDLAEHDAFLWNLRPQGALDYNDGSIDSGADIRNDIATYTDTILQVQGWTIAKLNQIIVNGAINPITGEPYTGIWNDEVDQQANGINSDTIEDAQLNTDAKCQTKADTMGGNESVRTRVRFKFRKTSYGLIQVGQTITFKYDITNYMTISEAQFILDRMIMNIKTEMGYAEISSGL